MRIAVIGGGISGLATAYRLKTAGAEVKVFEAAAFPGGNIRTEHRDGFVFEHGPNSFLSNRELVDLIHDLNLTGEVAAPRPDAKTRYIVRDSRMIALPAGPGSLVTSKAFSARGKASLLAEPFVRSRSRGEETVFDFFNRRLGSEIAEYALDPFISGIYAGDPHKLSIKSAFPRLYDHESRYGSILRGILFSPKDKAARLPKGWPRSFTLKRGSSALVKALAAKLGESLVPETNVSELSKALKGYSIRTESGIDPFDVVVISTPAHAAAALISELDPDLAAGFESIYYPPIAVVFTGFNSDQIPKDPAGFGVLVPTVEKRGILGSLFNSSAFEGRSPSGTHLFTTFIGGSRNAEYCQKDEDELIAIAVEELRSLLAISGDPIVTAVKKWSRSIPQYNVGHEKVTEMIGKFEGSHPGIYFCSNFYKGISVGDCAKNAASTSARILEYLSSKR